MFDLIPFERRNNGLFDYFDRMMNDNFFNEFEKGIAPCRTDILDQGDKFVLKADMPGYKKEDIKIGIEGDRLTISAEHNEETSSDQNNYIRRERRYGAVSRSFDIEGIDAGGITAAYDGGVLSMTLPKLAATKPTARQVEIQ